ncbi:hypothetical protein LOY37_12325 [Pseudomonas sp. B21-012]|uniref:RHS repeat-associated core domain-containing protein n=1 Tax=Pseudomonas sp. B21-012 TaxID=2895472 RepID=UPI00215F5953|nr:RHS repeat-associated core domain-containing protein [Pseudomonas sp. B21-012]UVM58328.1 hypothetical protein LOY37_12325 [Pseudomonas sp. B21-012]
MSNSALWLRGTVFDHKQVIGDDGFHYDLVYPYFLHSGDYLKRLLSHEFALQYRKHETPEPLETLSSPAAMVSFFNDTFASDLKDFDAAQAAEPLFGAALLDFYLKNDINRIQQTYPQPMVNTDEMARRLAVLKKNPQAVIRAYDDRFENMRNSTFNCAFDARESSFGHSCSGSSVAFRPVEANRDIQADDVWLLPGVFYRGAYMPVLEGVEVWLASFTSDMSRVEIGTTFAAGSEFKVRYHFIVDTRRNTGKTLHNFLRAFATIFGGTGAVLGVTAGGKDIADDDSLIPSIPGTQTSNFSWVRGTVHDHKQVTDMQGQRHPLVYPEFTRRFDLFLRDYLRGELPATFNEPVPADQAEPPLGNDAALVAYFNETFATEYSIETYKDAQFGPQGLISRFDPQKDSELRPRSPLSDTLFNNRLENFRRKPRRVLEAFDKRFANLVVGQHYAALNAADSTLGFGSAGDAVFKLSDQGGQQRADSIWLVPGLADEYTELPVLDGIETWWVLLSPDHQLAQVGVQPSPMEVGWTYHKIVVDTERNSGKEVHQLIQGLAGYPDVQVYLNGAPMLLNDWPVSRPNGESVYVEPEWREPAVWIRGTIDNYKVVHGDDRQNYRLAHPDFLDRADYLFEMLENGNFPEFPGMGGEMYGDPYIRDDLAVAQFIQDHYGYPVEDQLLHKKLQGQSEWGEYFWQNPETLDRLQSKLPRHQYEQLLHLLQTNPDMVFNAYDDRFANMRVGKDLASFDPLDSTFGYSCAGNVIFRLQDVQSTSSGNARASGGALRSGDATAKDIYLLPGLYDGSKHRPDKEGIEVWTVSVSAEGKEAQVGMTAQDPATFPLQYTIIVDTERTTAAEIYQLITSKDKAVTQINLHGAVLGNTADKIPAAAEALANVGYSGERYVSIDPSAGKSNWNIPVARLVGNDGLGPMFDLGLVVDGAKVRVQSLDVYTCERELINDAFTIKLSKKLRLSDGRLIAVDILEGQSYEGEDYTLHAAFNRLDVVRKNGVIEVYRIELSDNLNISGIVNMYLDHLISPSGRQLKFSWLMSSSELSFDFKLIESIADDAGVLVKFTHADTSLNKLSLFPGSGEEVNYDIANASSTAHTITAAGKGLLGGRRYDIRTDGNQLKELKVSTTVAGAAAPSHVQTESLTYLGDKVSTYTIAPGGGIDALTETYNYDTPNQVTISCSQGWLNVGKRVLTFEHGRQTKETRMVAGVSISSEQSMQVDDKRHVLVVTSRQQVDGATVEQVTYELDPRGNIIKLIKGEEVTEWTYFNNYRQYRVKEDKVTTHASGFFNALLKPLDYANPVGWGFLAFGSSGLTWGTRIDSAVDMSVSANNYAKSSFNLPLDINYPGDVSNCTSHVESEYVYLIKEGGEVPQRVTYYGYEAAQSPAHEALGRQHSVLPAIKLTVLKPDIERVDISAQQLAVANFAAKPLLDSLEAQKNTVGAEEKKKLQRKIDELKDSLLKQSKIYSQGFKLKSMAEGSMQVEKIGYHKDTKDTFQCGRVSSVVTHFLDGKGNVVAGSETETKFEYKIENASARKVKTTTTVSVDGKSCGTSSQTRVGFGGRLEESLDSQGITTTLSYGEGGVLTKEKVSRGESLVRNTDYAVTVVDGGYQYERSTEHGKKRTVTDKLGRETHTWICLKGNDWLEATYTQYDSRGRVVAVSTYDYDGSGAKQSTHITSWAYAGDGKTCTVTIELKNAAEEVIDTKVQVVEVSAKSKKVTMGKFFAEMQYNFTQHSLVETFGAVAGKEYLKQVSNYSESGQLKEAKRYKVVTADGVASEFDSIKFSYNDAGEIDFVTPKDRKTTTYAYDLFGRQTAETLDGVTLVNNYSNASLTSVAISSSVKADSTETSLGKQTIDVLGRVATRTVSGAVTTFSYDGASGWAKESSAGAPPAVDGCSSNYDSKTLTYTESFPQLVKAGESVSRVSKTEFSLCGKILKFTDVVGNVTAYQYDALGRRTGSTSSACITTLTYADNGQLTTEVIQDVASGKAMIVDYTYDVSGNETSRKFSCDGLAAHTLVRTYFGDGRLKSSALQIDDDAGYTDNYTYDGKNRVGYWGRTGGKFPLNENGKKVVTQTFSYDALGNSTSQVSTHAPENTHSTFSYASKQPGALTEYSGQSLTVDTLGRTTNSMGRHITYHENGQVNTYGVTFADDPTPYTFNYDDRGRYRGTTLGSRTETYHYRGDKIYALHQINTKGSRYYGKYERSITLLNESGGCFLQQVISRAEEKSESLKATTFELRDAAGSVFASFNAADDVVNYFHYLPYGYRPVDPKSTTWLGFKGEPLHELGIYYLGNGYRVYHPILQHFQSPDSWSPFGAGGAATYVYCGGDPVNYHDPSGHVAVAQYSRMESQPFMYTKEFRIATAVLGVLTAPFSGGGASMALAVAATGLAIVAAGFEIASALLEESDPGLSSTLAYVGLGFGMASAVSGVTAAKLATTRGARTAAIHSAVRNETGAERAVYFGNLHKNTLVTVVPKPKQFLRWYQESIIDPRYGDRHFWGANTTINGGDLQDPVQQIIRRGSHSDVHFYSGAHGERSGNNWVDKPLGGRPSAIRNSKLDEAAFFKEDLRKLSMNNPFPNKRAIAIHELNSQTPLAVLDAWERQPGHHIMAFCYGRNDERFLSVYNLLPVPSYAP